MERFYRHWNHRLGLETLKMEHATKYGLTPSEHDREYMKEEIAKYIDDCYTYEEEVKYRDVFVTDHKAVDVKCTT
jgi:hypothetical protein